MLLFEVINNGEYLNPNAFYEMKIEELITPKTELRMFIQDLQKLLLKN